MTMIRGFNDVPKNVWDELEIQIHLNLLECTNKRRAYRVSDGLHKEQFIAACNSGQCGVYESSTIHNGEKWIIGCNYGH